MRLLHDETGKFEAYAEHALSIISRANISPVREALGEAGNDYTLHVAANMHSMCKALSNPNLKPEQRGKAALKMVMQINMAVDRRGIPVQQEHPIIQEMDRLQGEMFKAYLEKSELENKQSPRQQIASGLKKAVAVGAIVTVGAVAKLGWEVHQADVEMKSKEHVWGSISQCLSEDFSQTSCQASVITARKKILSDFPHFEYEDLVLCESERSSCTRLRLNDGKVKIFAEAVGWIAYESSAKNGRGIEQDVTPIFATDNPDVAETVSGHQVSVSHFRR